MNDIDIAYDGVKVAVADLDGFADTLRTADSFVQTYFSVQPGGKFLTDASRLIDGVRENLGSQYLDLGTKVDDASSAVLGMWKDFERTDGRARLEFEEKRKRGISGINDLVEPPTPIAPHPPPEPATRSLDPDHLRGLLANPQADARILDAFDTWQGLKDGIDKALAFDWLVGPLETVGIHVPLDRFKQWMEGNYLDLAEVAAGTSALASYFEAVHDDFQEVAREVGEHWLGDSAVALQAWLLTLAGSANTHRGALNSFSSQLQLQAQTCKLLVDQVLDLLDDLADCVPSIQLNGDKLIDKALDIVGGLLESLVRAILAAVRVVTKLVTKAEILFDAVMVMVTIMASAHVDLNYPPITRPQAPPR